MKHIYWIKFRDDRNPQKFEFESMIDMIEGLKKYIIQSGWIEWMQRG